MVETYQGKAKDYRAETKVGERLGKETEMRRVSLRLSVRA